MTRLRIRPSLPPALRRWLPVLLAPAGLLAAFAYAAGWLTPDRLGPARIVDAFQANAGVFPGYRRNHAKGVCVSGRFDSNGALAPHTRAPLFSAGSRTAFVGRFAIPGGNPHAPDGGGPVRSFALAFTLPDGQQWRTGMNNSPVFAVATPEAFHAQLQATRPDPATGKPDPQRLAAFFAAHPATAAFRAWAKATAPSASYASERYGSLNAFYLVDANGVRQPVRWQLVPDDGTRLALPADTAADVLDRELEARLSTAPLRWELRFVFGAPGDPVDDATQAWPAGRQVVNAGTVVVERATPQAQGPCRDINFDPLVLPDGIEASSDPLLAARSAVYAQSHLRRSREQARLGKETAR